MLALARLTEWVYGRRYLVLYPQMLLFACCVYYTAMHLRFDVSRNDLVGEDKRYHQNFLRFKREFPAQDDLVVVVESENREKNRQFVERLGRRLEAETNLFTDIFYKGDLKMMGPKALLFVKEDSTLVEMRQALIDNRPFIQKFTKATNLVSLFGQVNRQFASAQRATNTESAALVEALPALQRIIDLAADSILSLGTPPSPGVTTLFGGGPEAEQEMYITFDASSMLKEADLRNPKGLILRLRDGLDPVSRYIQSRLSEPVYQALEQYKGVNPPSRSLRKMLLAELNRVLRDRSLYDEERFRNTELSIDVKGVLAQDPSPEELVRLNRKLLDAVYGPGLLAPSSNVWIYLVTAHAPAEELNDAAIVRLRELVGQIRHEVPGVNADITGEPILEHDEMSQSQADSALASIVSLVLCAMIFVFGYQETGRPLKAVVCLAVGLGYTMGFTTLVVGRLNILTITFVPILIGLAIDFGVHLITRYEEELRHGQPEKIALTRAMVNTGQGILTGAFTTAGAFFAMVLTDFRGIQEMGIICGAGMLLCLFPMMTMLPVLLLRGRQNVIDRERGEGPERRARLEQLWLQRPWLVAGVAAILCALALVKAHNVGFDYDLRNMQSEGLPAVVYEKKLIESASKSVLFAAVMTDTLQRAVAAEREIASLPAVASVDSVGRYLSGDQSGKLALVRAIKKEVEDIQFDPPDNTVVHLSELNQTLWSLQGYLGLAIEAAKNEDADIARRIVALRDSTARLRSLLTRGDTTNVANKLTAFQVALLDDLRETFEAIKTQDDQSGLRVEDLPPALRNRFVGRTGKYLLQVYPKEDVWQREHQGEFVRQLRTFDPNVTGTPVQLYEYTKLLKQSYEQAAQYALGAIMTLVFLHFWLISRRLFHSLLSVALALTPVAVGSLWLVGFMGWSDILFNPANIMTLPLVIGIGVTNGIHVLNRYEEEKSPSILAKSTGKAVLVSGLTTVAGFGSLILAKHQGIASLGYVMSVGVGTCMIAGLTFLPALLTLMIRLGWRQQ
jgi:hypothetical protein